MEEDLEAPIEFRRIGGFLPFPFFPSRFEIGEFRIIWKHWLLFESFEVKFCGTLLLKTTFDAEIVSMNRVDGYFKEKVAKGLEGVRITARLGQDEFFTECKLEKEGEAKERLKFTAYGNSKIIGSFSWPVGNEEVITGLIQKERFSEAWFWGMCLMKLWRVERDRNSGF